MNDTSIAVGADEWTGRTGNSWAAQWRRTDRSFAMLTERLLQRIGEHAFDVALDIGCGAGELSLAMARLHPHSCVVGVDISPQLLDVARQRACTHHSGLTFELADAATWRPAVTFAPELIVSRHGVMFFADPVSAFAHLGTLVAPRANLLFSCFRTWEENPAFADVARLLPTPPPPPASDAPGPFAFSDRARVERILAEAGWADIAFEPYDFAMVVGAGADPIADTGDYFASIGPAARALREMDEPAREQFFAALRELADRNLREGIISLRAGAWIVSARRP